MLFLFSSDDSSAQQGFRLFWSKPNGETFNNDFVLNIGKVV
jgi:hypothetical protein